MGEGVVWGRIPLGANHPYTASENLRFIGTKASSFCNSFSREACFTFSLMTFRKCCKLNLSNMFLSMPWSQKELKDNWETGSLPLKKDPRLEVIVQLLLVYIGQRICDRMTK